MQFSCARLGAPCVRLRAPHGRRQKAAQWAALAQRPSAASGRLPSTLLPPMTTARFLTTLAGVLLALPSAHAMDLRPGGVFAQAGTGDHSLQAAAVGLLWPWSWQRA